MQENFFYRGVKNTKKLTLYGYLLKAVIKIKIEQVFKEEVSKVYSSER